MAELEKLLVRIGNARDAISRKTEQTSLDYMIDGVLMNCSVMLKEQEAVKPYQRDAVWLCGNCEREVVGWDDDIDGKEYRYPFCRQCGRPVKWEHTRT